MRVVLLIYLIFAGDIFGADLEPKCDRVFAEIAQKVIQATEVPLSDSRVIGYHGTSQHALDHLLRTGHLPRGYDADGIFAYPSKSELNGIQFIPHSLDRELENTGSYADGFAIIHAVAEEVGLENNSQNYGDLLADWDTFCSTGRITEPLHHVSAKKLTAAFKRNISRRGFMLGISESATPSIIPKVGDPSIGYEEFIVPSSSPLGVSIDGIVSIVPRGPREQTFLDELRRAPGKQKDR